MAAKPKKSYCRSKNI